jgi:4-hydroxybenzoate polyprenyltransferase
MVGIFNHILILFRLIRLPNLLIVAASQILIRQCIMLPILRQNNLDLQLSATLFTLLVLATVFIAAGGYAINDYFDRKMDRVNKPKSVIVGKLIYPRHAMAYHLGFSIAGVILGTWVSFRVGLLFLSVIFFIVTGLLWFYSTTYKRELLLGNFIVALIIALVPFLVLLFELPLLARTYGSDFTPQLIRSLFYWVLGFSLFAFLLNLIREIIKDAEDFEGDQAFGKRTLPVVIGMKKTCRVASSIILLTAILLALSWKFFIPDNVTLIYFITLLIAPLLIVFLLLLGRINHQIMHITSTLMKLIMIAGLGYMIMVYFIINSM